jgi:uncharacterized membrane protein YeaQ/YmgE (transglycosylase-associated protein family)
MGINAGMNLIVTILIGLSAGLMVELLLPGHHKIELVLATLLGIAGALLARVAGHLFGWYSPDEAPGFVASIVGAVLILLLYGAVFRKKRP